MPSPQVSDVHVDFFAEKVSEIRSAVLFCNLDGFTFHVNGTVDVDRRTLTISRDKYPVSGGHEVVLYRNGPGHNPRAKTARLDGLSKVNAKIIDAMLAVVAEQSLIDKEIEAVRTIELEIANKLQSNRYTQKLKEAGPRLYATLKELVEEFDSESPNALNALAGDEVAGAVRALIAELAAPAPIMTIADR